MTDPEGPTTLNIQSTSNFEVLGFPNPIVSGLISPKALEYEVFVIVDVQGRRANIESGPNNHNDMVCGT